MSKRSKIKWRDSDLAELQRVVKNFNAKVSRTAKKNPHVAQFLPERISVKDLKTKIVTRQDFNRELNSYKRFSRKGEENVVTLPGGVTLTKFALNEARIKSRIVEGAKTRERKASGASVEKGTMGSIDNNNLRPKKFNPNNKSQADWDKFVNVLRKKVQSTYKDQAAEEYKQKYLDTIRDYLGEDGEELHELASSIDADKLYKHSSVDAILSIAFISDPLPTETIAETAINTWNEILKK